MLTGQFAKNFDHLIREEDVESQDSPAKAESNCQKRQKGTQGNPKSVSV
jgi:hypothetical protein